MTLMIKADFSIKRITHIMKQNGFTLFRRCFYFVKNNVAYCIEFESPTNYIYAHFYVIPLYIPHEERMFSLGNRFSMVPEFDLPPLNRDLPESEAVAWCDKFKNCINEYVFPFFSSISSPQKILDFFKKADDENNTYFFCPELFKLRTQVFSALFIEKTEQARILIPRYKKEIKRSTFLMPAVLDSLTAEVLGIEKMLLSPSLALTSYFEKNIKDTLFNCFNKTGDDLKS